MSPVNSPTKKITTPKMLGQVGRSPTAPIKMVTGSSSLTAKGQEEAPAISVQAPSLKSQSLKTSSSDGDLRSLFESGGMRLDDMTTFYADKKEHIDPKIRELMTELMKKGYDPERALQRANEINIKEEMHKDKRPSLEDVDTSPLTQELFYAQNADPFSTGKVNASLTPLASLVGESVSPDKERKPSLPSWLPRLKTRESKNNLNLAPSSVTASPVEQSPSPDKERRPSVPWLSNMPKLISKGSRVNSNLSASSVIESPVDQFPSPSKERKFSFPRIPSISNLRKRSTDTDKDPEKKPLLGG